MAPFPDYDFSLKYICMTLQILYIYIQNFLSFIHCGQVVNVTACIKVIEIYIYIYLEKWINQGRRRNRIISRNRSVILSDLGQSWTARAQKILLPLILFLKIIKINK